MKKNFTLLALFYVLFISISCHHDKTSDPKPAENKPIAAFSFKADGNGVLPCTVSFVDSSKYADTYKWDFNDNNTSTERNPRNVYTVAKTYNVKLVVSNSYGKDSITKQVTITLNKPKADFAYTIVDNGNLPTTVNFTNKTIGGGTYTWYFDDGNKSTLNDPVEKYSASKVYNVKLVAVNSVGKDSITKQVEITIAKPTATVNYVITTTEVLPASVNFTCTAQRAVDYLWDFNDGTTSSLQNPTHLYKSGGIYNVTLTVSNSSGAYSLSQSVSISPYPVTYTSFDNKTYTLYSWEGEHVTLLMRKNGLDAKTMFKWVAIMDKCYLYYKSVTGKAPSYIASKVINGRSTIADVATSCGAGCGYLGSTRIEMLNTYTDRMYDYVYKYNQFDQELFYEFGRNYWFYADQLAYKDNDPITTGYAIFMRFMAMDATGVSPAPFNSTPWPTFRKGVEDLAGSYQANPSYTWDNTLAAGKGITNPLGLGASDLVASFLIKLRQDYGGDAFVNNFWKQAGLRPKAATTQDAVDNFFIAACAAANKNLTVLFETTWRWPLSANAKAEAANYK